MTGTTLAFLPLHFASTGFCLLLFGFELLNSILLCLFAQHSKHKAFKGFALVMTKLIASNTRRVRVSRPLAFTLLSLVFNALTLCFCAQRSKHICFKKYTYTCFKCVYCQQANALVSQTVNNWLARRVFGFCFWPLSLVFTQAMCLSAQQSKQYSLCGLSLDRTIL